ncbi:MAG TPA: phosphomannomutase/phosphoglucomutase [Tepidisphaeraceae bacterium]|nr:phosphomannomutase/phosphoglucomutase [Tepidisphaeraceae bacterium]
MIEKIFKAYDVRATYPSPLDEEAAWKVGRGTAEFLKNSRKQNPQPKVALPDTIVVGRDMRPHSPALAGALSDGIRSAGMNVIDVGMIDTSFIYFAINHLDAVGGIQTTASHNPAQYNGFKISGPKAKPIGSATGLDEIKRIASALTDRTSGGAAGAYEQRDLWAAYRDEVLKFLQLKRPLTVAIDASNGMGGKMIPEVFGKVKGLTIVPILFEITGAFVHEPNPLVEANLAMLKEKMKQQPVDAGACFDGDADRCMFLDEAGKMIGCDLLTALLAEDYLRQPANKGASVVYDLRSSHVVADTIKQFGGVPVRDRVGHAFIKKTMAERQAIFGGELSGHIYFRDYYYADSAAVAFARVLSILSAQDKPLSQLMGQYQKYSQSGEINFQVEDKDGKIRELAEVYKRGEVDYLDGITVDLRGDAGGDWWFNVRKSNTEPLLRLNLEAKTAGEVQQRLHELQRILGEPAHGH